MFFAVPEYQVVSIHSRSKRSVDENRLVSFNAFGKDVRLQLRKNPHLVKQVSTILMKDTRNTHDKNFGALKSHLYLLQSLRMWIAEPDSSEGVNYKELPQVKYLTHHYTTW